MTKPSLPDNEKSRLSALKKLDILDTPAEKEYDNITELAAYICQTPIALITLIDEKRQWFKSKIGIDACDNDRDLSFCGHAITSPKEILEIPDARLDERFKDNPATLAEKKPVIFYAGIPLTDNDGHALGTLCLIDHKPRELDPKQLKALVSLGYQVNRLFELRLKNNRLRSSKAKLSRRNSLLRNFAGTVSHDMKMPLANIILTIDVLKKKYGKSLDEKAIEYLDRLKQSSFGMSDYISNILEYYETENLSPENITEEPFDLKDLLESIIDMMNIEDDCEINFPDKNLDLVCNRSGLEQILLNLLGNSLKYNDKDKMVINIDYKETPDFYEFTVTDNGIGIPEDQKDKIFDLFSTVAERDRNGQKGNGIGLSTVQKLVHNLGGKIDVASEEGKSTSFTFSIKKQKQKQKKIA